MTRTTLPTPDPDDHEPTSPPSLNALPSEPAADRPARGIPRTSWTADELMATEFPEPRWAVRGILSEGVNLLAGPPKVGKSWLSLGLGLAVAAGGRAFASVPVDAGPVLYLALEDTPRRLQSRMRKILNGTGAPPGLTLVTSCPPLPQGGDTAIARWLDGNPAARLVVIDVFAKMRGAAAPGASAYDADYASVGYAKRLADHYGVAFVLVHHVRKQGSDDFLTEVSGTNGLAGAADATLVLKRGRGKADGILHVTGRDVEEAEYALQFAKDSGMWRLLEGPASDHTIGDTRARIVQLVRSHPGIRPKALAEALPDVDAETAGRTLRRMAADGQVIKDAAGRYYPDNTQPTPEVSALSACPETPHDQHKPSGQPRGDVSGLSGSGEGEQQ